MIPNNLVPFCQNETLMVVGSVAAGTGLNVECCEIEQMTTHYTSPEYVALRVCGDSMCPKIEDGDTVIVHRQDDVHSGEIAAVLINGDLEATIKTVHKQADGIILEALNPEVYPARYFSEKDIMKLPVRIFGKVVETRKPLRKHE